MLFPRKSSVKNFVAVVSKKGGVKAGAELKRPKDLNIYCEQPDLLTCIL